MNAAAHPLGILVVGHGSPRAEANEGFLALVGRIAQRLVPAHVLPAFFSIARPNIQDQVAVLASRGVGRIVLMPYFLYSGQHVSGDIPLLMEECRAEHPGLVLEILPTLENDWALEDVVVDRLMPLVEGDLPLPADGPAIQRRSFAMIDRQLARWEGMDVATRQIVRRVIHSTADFSFAHTLRIHPRAVESGLAALDSGRPIVCDVTMLQAGITQVDNEVLCLIGDEEVSALARQQGCTRAAAAMERLAPRWEGAIVAVGNAPTALWKLLEIVRAGGPRPALVVGLPVGFVGAQDSKLALLASDLCSITNTSPRGGSPVAAAVINALAALRTEEE